MADSSEQGSYAPIGQGSGHIERAHRLPFDISTLSVTGLVIICELDDPSRYGSRSDAIQTWEGLVSWKQPAADVISEVLSLVQEDGLGPDDKFPWEEYAEAAQRRGISVDADALRDGGAAILWSQRRIMV